MVEVNSVFISDLYQSAKRIDTKPFANKNILITGATGMVGSAVAKFLLVNNDIEATIYVAGRSLSKIESCYTHFQNDKRLRRIIMDVTESINCSTDFHFIIDCASYGNPKAFTTTPVDVIKSNVTGVDNLLHYGIHHGLERLLFVSSGEIYGEGDGRDFEESFSGYVCLNDVRACYPLAKRTAELLCRSYIKQYNTDVTIVRPCHIYGPNFTDSDDRAFAQFFRNVISGENIVLKSPGAQFRSWLYVVDCASAIIHALIYGENGESYNIAPTNECASIKQFAQEIAAAGGKDIIFDIPDGANTKPIISRGVLNSEKINGIGWTNSFTLKSGIEHTYNELKIQNHT